MRYFLYILCLLFFVPTQAQRKVAFTTATGIINENKILYVWIYAGQSNQSGGSSAGSVSAPYLDAVRNAWVYAKTDTTTGTNFNFSSLFFGKNQNWRAADLIYTGPILSSAYDYVTSTGHKSLFIHYSLGGSGLGDDSTTTATSGLWAINADATRSGTWGRHYYRLVYNFVIPAIQKAQREGYTVVIKGLSWMQGETDATNLINANNYETNLIALFDKFKVDVAPYSNTDSMHFIIGRIHNNFTGGTRPYMNTVRTAQVNVATHYGYYGHWYDTDAYALDADLTHWTLTGQITHGLAVSTIMKSIAP